MPSILTGLATEQRAIASLRPHPANYHTVVHADCLDWLPMLEADSCDSCVTDPPYDLGFMGKHWDRQGVAFRPETWAGVFRVLKPGAYLLAFGGTRTYHRLVCAIEDAGFEIRDTIAWLYGQGFPKSLDVSKALDKRAGAERGPGLRVARSYPDSDRWKDPTGARAGGDKSPTSYRGSPHDDLPGKLVTLPATPEAQQWSGWGTALKPAMELICVARKPLSEKTVAENVLRWGTGAINVDGCRIAHSEECRLLPDQHGDAPGTFYGQGGRHGPTLELKPSGRWPANVVLDEEAGAMLDEQSGDRPHPGSPGRQPWYKDRRGAVGNALAEGPQGPLYFDNGGASRFFYCPKASRREREAGCEELARRRNDFQRETSGLNQDRPNREGRSPAIPPRNHHPTVKPIALMRWLVRLVTPPGGILLEPFAGSGSTCIAAGMEGFDFLACEREKEYVEIAEARLAHWLRQGRLAVTGQQAVRADG